LAESATLVEHLFLTVLNHIPDSFSPWRWY